MRHPGPDVLAIAASSTSRPSERRKRARKSAPPKLGCRPRECRAPERYTIPAPSGLRSVVTLSSVAMRHPSGTWSVNHPWGSVSTGMTALLYDLAGARAGQGAVPDHGLPAHQHVADALRVLHRVLEGGPVRDRRLVQHDDVGAMPHHERARPAQA